MRHVRRPAVDEQEERLVAMRPQPFDDAVERMRSHHPGGGKVSEQERPVEDEARHRVTGPGECVEYGLRPGGESGVPVEVPVPMRVDARHHRRHGRGRPRRGGDRLLECEARRGELVDGAGVEEPGPVAAEMVGAERVGDEDEDVHPAR